MKLEIPSYQNLQENRSYSNELDNKEVKGTGICKTISKGENHVQMINVTHDEEASNLFDISKLSNVYTNQNELSTSNHTYQNLQEKQSSSNGLDNKENIDAGIYITILKEDVAKNNIQKDNDTYDHKASNQLTISR